MTPVFFVPIDVIPLFRIVDAVTLIWSEETESRRDYERKKRGKEEEMRKKEKNQR
jgi:hypothetical protein